MSPAPATRNPPPRRPRQIVEGLFAAAALIAFVAGVPVVLRIVAPISWPNPWPTWGQAGAALSRPDDGTLFTGALTVVVWAGWAWLTVSILIEVVDALTHVKIPPIALLKLSRGAAKTLIATAGVLLATSTPLVTSGALHTPTSIQLVLPKQPTTRTIDATLTGAGTGLPRVPHAVAAAQRFTAPSLPAAVDRHPVITVRRGDNLWDLAERHLGAGQRFTEIVDLNLHRPQPDGRTLTEEGWVYPGWTLRLPQDAGALPAPTATTADVATDGSQTVQDVAAGDSLWAIAETRLGDGARYPEIYDLNIGAPQPGGATLTDPDLIRPGWHLAVPAGRPAPTTPAPSTAPDRAPQPPPTGDRTPAPHVQPDTSAQASSSDVDPRSYARQGARGVAAPSEPAAGETRNETHDPPPTAGSRVLVLGLTTLAAAGLTGELARRRRRQHRLRRAGERIALPEPGSAGDLAERALRQAAEPMTLDALRTGLLHLSSTCSAEGRNLPRLAVIVVGEDTLDVIVTADDESPVKPFVSIDARNWRTSHDAFRNQHDPVDLEMFPDPYPALVTLGITDRGTVLVNLEATGTFSVNGTEDVTAAGMRALACELATSALTANTVLVLGPEYADLAQASPSVIITNVPDGADLDRRSGVLAAAHRDILARAGVTDALHARTMLTGDDTWNPTVFLGSGQRAAAQAWAGHVIVTAGKKTEWRLDLRDDYTGRLEPVGLTIEAQHLPADAYRNLVELLQKAGQETERDELDELVTVDEELDQIRTALPEVSRALTAEALSKESSAVDGDLPADPARATPEAGPPRVLLLGRVSVTGVAHGKADRERRNTELVAFLACNPGASADQIDDVLGHGARIDNKNRNARISRIRSWLGSDGTGRPYLMRIESHDDYRLAPAIRSDWDDFLALANRGLAQGKDGAADLRAALTLVRGRPFLGVPRGSYAWADALTHEMIDTITDVAHALALIDIDTHDYRGAQRAAAIGLTANSCNEQLFRDAIAAAHRAGDDNEVDRLVTTLRTRIEQIDPDGDLEGDTIELIETLQLAESNDP